MILYSCEISLSLDRAVIELDKIGAKYRVSRETELVFRKAPTRAAKIILDRCGFVREPDEARKPVTVDKLKQLEQRFNMQPGKER